MHTICRWSALNEPFRANSEVTVRDGFFEIVAFLLLAKFLLFLNVGRAENPTLTGYVISMSSSQDDVTEPLLRELKWSRSLLCEEQILLEAVGDIDSLLFFRDAFLPFLDDGEESLTCDVDRSEREVRRLGGGSVGSPGKLMCHPRNFGDAELPLLAFTGEVPVLPKEATLLLDPLLVLLCVGVEDLGVGVEGLFWVVDLLVGVVERKTAAGLELRADDGLPLN